MKFLCVPCDEPMKLSESNPPDRGSLSLVYRCPTCAHEMAMLTNPRETEVVRSMGVKIGHPALVQTAANGSVSEPEANSTCAGARWTDEALARLENVPPFVRPMARRGIEEMAREKHYSTINKKVMDEAKELFGM